MFRFPPADRPTPKKNKQTKKQKTNKQKKKEVKGKKNQSILASCYFYCL